VRRQPISHSQRRSMLYRPCHDAMGFELPQLLAEHLDGYSWHGPPKLAESENAFAEAPKDHWLPSALNHPYGSVHRTSLAFGIARCLFAHNHSQPAGYFKVPPCVTTPRYVHCSRNMPSAHLFRVIVPVSSIEDATVFYSAVLDQPGRRISPGRHYFGCGSVILACFDPRADGDSWDARPNPDHLYFAVDDLEEYFRRVSALPGSSVLRPIETQPWGERSFYCADPFGNKLCFVDERTLFTAGLI
jgi:predicted enzyme related to lactoylglutathione lyase